MKERPGAIMPPEAPQDASRHVQPGEVVLFDHLDNKTPKNGIPRNKLNRAANVAIAHGVFIGGIYRDHGIPRPPKKSIDKTQK